MPIENILVYLCVLRDLCVKMAFYEAVRFDGPVKSPKSRHSRENGSPEVVEKTG